MSFKYSVPRPLKAKLLAWTELNINEVDMLINLFHNGSNNEIYRLIKNFLSLFNKNLNICIIYIYILKSVFKALFIYIILSYLEKNFDLNPSSRPKDKILIDLHYYALKFAFANNFSKIQISSFVSIVRALHRANQGRESNHLKKKNLSTLLKTNIKFIQKKHHSIIMTT